MKLRQLSILIALVGIFALWLIPSAPARAADAQWRARYWNNRNLSGPVAWERSESTIDNDWGSGSPNTLLVNSDNFSARWNRVVDLPAGNYRFSATTDDGMRVWIDDQLIIDSWTDSQVHTVTADRALNGGEHAFRVEYYEAGGQAVAKFSWQQIGSTPGVFNFWRGEYFNNRNLSGTPTTLRDDANIDFNWGEGSPAPGIAADNFSVRWTRTLNFAPGDYRFEVFSDDGVRLWVNNQLVIDQWRDQADGRFAANVSLPGGATAIRMEYYEGTGRVAVALSWSPPGGSSVPGTGGPTVMANWRGEYFNNMTVSGAPTAVRDDPAINFNWAFGSPIAGVGVDRFSVRWTRAMNFPAGTYRFDVFSDDGVRLWANNAILIDQWRDQTDGRYSATVALSGATTIEMEYYENTGRAAVSLSWVAVSGGGATTPPPGGPTATVTTAYRLNVRAAPTTESQDIGTLSLGQTVGLTGYRSADSAWLEIFRPEGGTGWVAARYVTPSVSTANFPVR